MKKYIILLSVFILFFVGIFITTKILDKEFGVNNQPTTNILEGTDTASNENNILNSMQGQGKELELSAESTVVENPEGNYSAETEIIVDAKFSNEDWVKRNAAGLTNSNIALTMQECAGRYGYSKLDASLHQLYAEILLVYQNQQSGIPLCSTDVNAVEKVSTCVLLDYPEIFYTDGYSYEQYKFAGNIQKISYSPNYIMTSEEISQNQAMIDQVVNEYLAELPQNASDYDKVKYVYEMVILNTEYNLDAPDNQNICSVFLGRESVCLGYAKAVQYLLQRINVEATVVTGSVLTGESHAWNLVKINGQYYYVDATWGDASYTGTTGEDTALFAINYDYLCITTQDITKTHIINHPISVPDCIVQIDNYYVKEGLYLTSMDTMLVENIFNSAKSQGINCISIRCANQVVYQDFKLNMLDNQHIFQYLGSGTTTLAYTTNDKLYTYTFML